ncbi:MAG: DUF4350 domain-containing protein [Chloroflexota bacterium]
MSVLILARPGQPVNAYGRYLAEILKTEGFADLEIASIDAPATLGALDSHDAVIVTRMVATKAQAAALVDYVRRGGRLVVIRPSRLLAVGLGLLPVDTVVAPAYVLPGDGHPLSAGVPQEPIQTHVPADTYELVKLPAGGTEVARLYGDATTPTSYPAVAHFPLGEGEVVVFTYDLAHAVSLIRQGDPLRVGGRGLGSGHQYRPEDLLIGFADPLCWHLPQADIHAMLLGNAINVVARRPQPRWWYYPTPETKSVVVLDSDDDWSAPEHFDALIESVERHGGHITIYLMLGPTKYTIATPEKVAAWRARGHSFGVHHNPFDPAFDGEEQEETFDGIVRRDVAYYQEHYGGLPITNRNHCVAWKGYVDLPRLYAELGTEMDLNVVSLRNSWLMYLNGSGRPMRFVDLDGTIVDCFQQATQAYDDASVKQKLSADPQGEAARTRRLMEEKVTRYFSPLSMLSHPVSFYTYSSEYMNRCWSSARELGMPIWSAFEWAAYTRARDEARIVDARWQAGRFSCRVEGRSPRGSLTLMLPVHGQRVLEARVDGQDATVHRQDAFGWTYSLIPLPLDAEQVCAREVVVRTGALALTHGRTR